MIDFSDIKNKSVVTFKWGPANISAEVVSETPSACTVKLPDGSITTIGKMYVTEVKTPQTAGTAPTTKD